MNLHQLSLLLALAGLSALRAQTPNFRYFYDDANELIRVLDSTGTLIEYVYDPSGNIIRINRSTIAPGSPAILNVSPLSGVPGNTITIYGQNFSLVASNNIVQINGVTAMVLSATATQLVIQVPAGATAGQITVTVAGVTVSSGPTLVYMPLPAPIISSLNPGSAIAGTTVPHVAVTGTNLTSALFSFSSGPTATTNSVTSTSADIKVTAMAGIRGAFPLVATTSAGSSTDILTPGNQFYVLLSPDEADGQLISVLNTADPISQSADPSNLSNSANSQMVSVLNTIDPISQSADPTDVSNAMVSQLVSVLNTVDPITQSADPTNVSNEADSALVSLNNTSTGSARPGGTVSALHGIREFSAASSAAGTLQVAQSGSNTGLVAGQRLAIGIRAPLGTEGVELFVNGAQLPTSRQRPWVFTLNVPVGATALVFSATARAEDGSQLASYGWQQRILPDEGVMLTGRVVDASGGAVSGSRASVETTGLYGEFFELSEAPTQMPDLARASRARSGLVSGLQWLNPQGVFGQNPIGMATTPAYAARFSGQIFAPESGVYAFQVNADASAALLIDGKPVSGSVELTAGSHAIEVSYYKAAAAAALEVLWTPPNGAGVALPIEGLTASDPSLSAIVGGDGAFSISGVPARVDGFRVLVQLPDGRSAASAWQAPVNGVVNALGDIVVPTNREGK